MSTFIPTSDLDLYSDDVLAEPVERFEIGTSTRKLNNVIRSLKTLTVTVHTTTSPS